MLQSYFNGLMITAGLIIAIGAQNAFVLAQGLKREHAVPAALLCISIDILLICAGVFGLASLLASHPLWLSIARWGGAAFLLLYGSQALRRALSSHALDSHATPVAGRTLGSVLLSTLAVTLLNPHVYLDTVLLIGSLGSQQAVPAAYAAGASSASALWFLSLVLLASWLAPWLARPLTWRLIDLMVAVMMYAIAWQLIAGGVQAHAGQ